MDRDSQSENVDQSDVKDRFEETRRTIGEDEIRDVIDGFEEKIESIKSSAGPQFVRKAIGHARLFYRLLTDWWEDRYHVPWKTITAIGAVLVYFINPFDMVPDLIPALGLVDDATMIYIGFSLIQDDLIDYALDQNVELESYGIDLENPRPTISS